MPDSTLCSATVEVKSLSTLEGDSAPVCSSLAAALSSPGLYLDAHTVAPLPAIKHALLDSANRNRRTLTLVDSCEGAEAAERLYRGLPGRRLNAQAYPRRTAENCRKHPEVDEAQKAGFDPGMAVCIGCEHRKDCGKSGYYHEKDRADDAQHAIATVQRASANLLDLTADRDAVFIASDRALSLFLPCLDAKGSATKLQTQLGLICDATWFVGLAEYPFWDGLRGLAKQLAARIGEIRPDKPGDGFIVSPPTGIDPPKPWAELLWAGMKQISPRPPADLVRLVNAVACRRSGEVVVAGSDRGIVLTTLGKQALPNKPIVVFAPESAKDLARATDRIVYEVGESKPLAVPTWQACTHFTAATRAETAVALIRSFLARPGVHLVGVICNKRTLEGTPMRLGLLKALEPLVKAAPGKVALALWRSDVRHLQNCDLILGLGTPTVSPSMVRHRLLQTGQPEAAAQSGDWNDELKWQATTAAGVSVITPCAGYRNKAWQEARTFITTTAIRRTLALIGSRPAVMLTDEQLSGDKLLNVSVVQAASRLTDRDAKILTALHLASSVRDVRDSASSQSCTPFLLQDSNTLIYLVAKMGFIPEKRHCLETDVLAKLTGLRVKLVRRRLTLLRAAGFADWNRREGWTLPTAVWTPIEAPGLPSLPSDPPPRNAKPVFDAAAAVLVEAIAGLVAARGGSWCGPAVKLEILLAGYARANRLKKLTAWIASADQIGRALRRLTVELAAVGVRASTRRSNGVRLIVFEKVARPTNREKGD